MSKWELYGDVNTIDEGGMFIRRQYDDNEIEYDSQKTTYEVIQIYPDALDENICQAGILSVDIADYRKDAEFMDRLASEYGQETFDDKELASCVVDYYGMVELSARSFNTVWAEYSMDLKAYSISKWELAKTLKDDYGIENDNINEWASKKVAKIFGYEFYDYNAKDAVIDSMLLDKYEPIAMLGIDTGDSQETILVEINGDVNVDYKGVNYNKPSEFPEELKNLIRTDKYWEGDENVCVNYNNWIVTRHTEDDRYSNNESLDESIYDDADKMLESLTEYAMEVYDIDIIENVKDFYKENLEKAERDEER